MHRVLVVDEDAQLLTILREELREFADRFEVVTVEDGLAALMALKEQSFSLVVTEIRLPIVNGLVVLAYIHKNYPKVPCIVMTAETTPFSKKRLQKEAAHFIEKPFEVKELAQLIMSVLGREVVFGGVLRGISIISFAKLIEEEGVTCLCETTKPNSQKGYLLFDEGVLYNAFYGKLRGEKAALKLLQTKDVKIRFGKPPKTKVPTEIETTLPVLIAEAIMASAENESPAGEEHTGEKESEGALRRKAERVTQ